MSLIELSRPIDMSEELAAVEALAVDAAQAAQQPFYTLAAAELRLPRKADGSELTTIDVTLANRLTQALGELTLPVEPPNLPAKRYPVATEEYAEIAPHLQRYLSNYGSNDPEHAAQEMRLDRWLTDPIDGTALLDQALEQYPEQADAIRRRCAALVSIGLVRNSKPSLGVVAAPFLDTFRVYGGAAEDVGSAYARIDGKLYRPTVDTDLQKGVILASHRNRRAYQIYQDMGYEVVSIDAAVARLITLIDPMLLHGLPQAKGLENASLIDGTKSVVGVISGTFRQHDKAGILPLLQTLGIKLSTLTGDRRPAAVLHQNGIIAANNLENLTNLYDGWQLSLR